MNPELSPPSWVRKAGSPSESDGLTSRSTRRSEMDASSATARAMRVERERDGLAVEVPVRDELSPVHEDEGVVRRSVHLDGHRVLDVGEEVAARTVHLRRAAKRVGVLHLVAPAVRLDDRRALEQANEVGRGGRLAGERAERLDLRHEADARALQRLDGERARDVRGLGDPAGADEPERADGAHELGPVDEREPLLRLQADRLEAGARERVRPWEELALEACRPLAHERKREMGERREIPRGADRAAARHDGQHSLVQAVEQELDGLDARSREAFRERVRAKHHRGADDLVRIRLPHPARVAAQEAELELLGELRRDRLRDEAAEAGVDAVGVLARGLRGGAVDELAGRGHLRAPVVGEGRRGSLDRDRPDVVDREIVSVQEHCGGDGHRGQV